MTKMMEAVKESSVWEGMYGWWV